MRTLVAVALLGAWPAWADTVVAARTIPGKALLGPEDIALAPGTVPGALSDPAQVVGREARFAIYAGRPIRAADLTEPALVERNSLVTLVFKRGGLSISTEGRALGRAAVGETVRVMNIGSRQTVIGRVAEDGRVFVDSHNGS